MKHHLFNATATQRRTRFLFTNSLVNLNSTTNWQISNFNIGPENNARVLLITTIRLKFSVNSSTRSLTVNGVSPTYLSTVSTANPSSNLVVMDNYYIYLPTGTTANIQANSNVSCENSAIIVSSFVSKVPNDPIEFQNMDPLGNVAANYSRNSTITRSVNYTPSKDSTFYGICLQAGTQSSSYSAPANTVELPRIEYDAFPSDGDYAYFIYCSNLAKASTTVSFTTTSQDRNIFIFNRFALIGLK